MTQEEKQILLKDLSARLPYGIIIDSKEYNEANYRKHYLQKLYTINVGGEKVFCVDVDDYPDPKCHKYKLESCRPYLRPMSSMTEEEKEVINNLIYNKESIFTSPIPVWVINESDIKEYIDFCNSHHLDWRGLIEKKLAMPAPEGMYKTD